MDFHSAAQWLDEVGEYFMPALQIKPEEIGTVDLARYQAIRQKMWAKPALVVAPVPAPIVQFVAPVAKKEIELSPAVCSFADYIAKDRTFDNSPLQKPRPRSIRVHEIIAIVCDVYGINKHGICSPRRPQVLVEARQEAMWLCRKFTSRSFPEIGCAFGGRDHTTVIHAVRKIDDALAARTRELRALPAVEKAVFDLANPASAAMLSEA